jgi:nicotinamide mononucleotide transporter
MTNFKAINREKFEIVFFSLVIIFLIGHAVIKNDDLIALISAICGITYTFIAGKGNPVCYIFGLMGSGFYCLLSYQNDLWGNLLLYLGYYIPMQILGFIKWNQNLKQNTKNIIKTRLTLNELKKISIISFIFILSLIYVLYRINGSHPILDSATTVLSIVGMYLTVKRAIEQWIFWMLVNFISLIMWIIISLQGARVFSTIIMWAVYLFLAIYFYFSWKQEINSNT